MAELLQHKFPNPFWTPSGGSHAPVWSDAPPHHIRTAVLLSCGAPLQEVVKGLLLGVQRLPSTLRSINGVALSSCEALPCLLPIWLLSFLDHLSEAYITCMSWRKCIDWVDPPSANRQRVMELGSLMDRLRIDGFCCKDPTAQRGL